MVKRGEEREEDSGEESGSEMYHVTYCNNK